MANFRNAAGSHGLISHRFLPFSKLQTNSNLKIKKDRNYLGNLKKVYKMTMFIKTEVAFSSSILLYVN